MTTYYKTILMVEILHSSDDPDPIDMDLSEIGEEGIDGSFSVVTKDLVKTELTREEMQAACIAQGSDPEFIVGDES